MTDTVESAIDNKTTQLGRSGCRRFLMETGQYVKVGGLFEKNYRWAIRSLLAAENWDDLNDLFLNWN